MKFNLTAMTLLITNHLSSTLFHVVVLQVTSASLSLCAPIIYNMYHYDYIQNGSRRIATVPY